MRKILCFICAVSILILPVQAMEFTAPVAPDSAEEFMPEDPQSFSEGLWYVLKKAMEKLQPSLTEAAGICLSLIAITLLAALLDEKAKGTSQPIRLAGTVAVSVLLVQPANSLITLGCESVKELCDYGKLLLPVLTGALAAQGGGGTSAALYAGTCALDAVLSGLISGVITPALYGYLCLCIACSAVCREQLDNLKELLKLAVTWCLKAVLYIFTGYLSITKVISGTVDASALKATKLAISGTVPVVGGLISDASETILLSAGIMKNAAGVYGLLAIISLWIGPFIKIGCQYLLLKLTAAICKMIGAKAHTALINDFSGAMGMLLAMVGVACLLLMVSTVCFMKGIG